LQSDDFVATSEKLDSILDRLNALGASAKQLSVAPLPSAESPDGTEPIVDDVPLEVPEIPVAVPGDAVLESPARGNGELDAVDLAGSFAGVDMTAFPAVDPGDPIESVTVVEGDSTDGDFDDSAPHEDVASQDGIEPAVPTLTLVAPLDDSAVEEPDAAEVDTFTPEPTEANESNEANEIAQSAFFPQVDVPEVHAQPSNATIPQADIEWATAEFDAFVAPLPQSDTALGSPVLETGIEPPVSEGLSFSNPVDDVPFDVFNTQPAGEPQIADQVAVEGASVDPVVEEHTVQLAVVPDVVDEPDTHGEGEDEVAEVPTAPMSIFGNSTFSAAPEMPEGNAPALDDADGWVSHHPEADAALEVEIADFEASAAETSDDDVELAADHDPVWEISEPLSGSIFDSGSSGDVDPIMMASEVEQTLNDMESLSDFSVEDSAEASIGLVDPVVVENEEGHIDGPAEAYATDEDLPIPDFTGVYDETEVSGTGTGVESRIDGIGARRAELEQLRPSEEAAGVAAESEKKTLQNLPFSRQLTLVGIFALAVLVLVWLFDPGALSNIRSGLGI